MYYLVYVVPIALVAIVLVVLAVVYGGQKLIEHLDGDEEEEYGD